MQSSPVAKKASGDRLPGHFNGKATQFPNALTLTFKQIFRDHWGPFQQRHPRYQDRHVQAVIDKMLGCGTLEAGYTTYLCPHCLEEKRVAFSCKSSFCLSCCKVYVDEWVAHIGRTLYEGVSYRHV